VRLSDLWQAAVKSIIIFFLRWVDPLRSFGTKFFEALARITVTFALETVYLRRRPDGTLEILLTLRGPKEAYADSWHSPGSVKRFREAFVEIIARLAAREFGVAIFALLPEKEWVVLDVPDEPRGPFVVAIALVASKEEIQETEARKWFSLSGLPENIVPQHRDVLIPRAVEIFEAFEARNAA
jgi:ADP-ribose pyrophosphatase YjhB (NUDIX family)